MKFERLKIKDVCTSQNKKRIPLSKMERDKLNKIYPYYGAQGVIDYVDDYLFSGTYLLVAEDGANLIERKEDIANIASGKFWVNNHAHILSFDNMEDLYYVNYFLNSTDISAYITGSAQPKLNSNNLMQIQINWPEKSTRNKISKILMNFDKKIEVNNKIIENLEAQAQAIFKSWFVDFEPFAHGDFVESELGLIPKGWEVKSIKEFSKEIITGKTPSTKIKDYYGDKIPFITIPDMHDNIYIIDSERYLSEKGEESQKNKTLPPNTICISCIATVGLVSLTSEFSQTNQQINSVIAKKDYYTYYLYLTLKNMYKYLGALGSSGSTTKNINKKTFESINILFPEEKIIKEFNLLCKNNFDLIKSNQIENKKLEEIRDTLLPKLMAGEIDIANISIED